MLSIKTSSLPRFILIAVCHRCTVSVILKSSIVITCSVLSLVTITCQRRVKDYNDEWTTCGLGELSQRLAISGASR